MAFEIEKIVDLVRIQLKPEEKNKLRKDIQSILGYVEKLNELKTDAIEPTSHVLNLENVYRPDRVEPSSVRDEVLEQAPLSDGKFFKVPKVVDKES